MYTFSDANGTLKFFIRNGELEHVLFYDSYYFEMLNFEVTSFETDFDTQFMDADRYEMYSYTEYAEILYGDFGDSYLNDEYWADEIDWNSIEGKVITDENELPEEYDIINSDKYYIDSFARFIAEEGSLFAEGDYAYTESVQYYNNGVLKVYDGYGISVIYKTEKNLLGKEEVACYLVYEDGNICTKLDALVAAMFGEDYSELTEYAPDQFKLLENRPHTVTVKETEYEGSDFMQISCAYEDASYITNFCFKDGELIRIDEYSADGIYQGTMLIYEFTTDFDDSVTSIDSYENVSTFEFFSRMFEI